MQADRIIDTETPSIGLVIGTSGSTPYIHLGLEVARRNCGDIPILVHDDASNESRRLMELCIRYDADFSSNDIAYGHMRGDLSVYPAGLRWAERRGIDILVKMSRRWIPLVAWIVDLQILAYVSQYGTYSNRDNAHGLGFRTECVAFHVPSWLNADMIVRIDHEVQCAPAFFIEYMIHNHARQIHENNCRMNQLYEFVHPKEHGYAAYGDWRLLGTSRMEKLPNILWRNTCRPIEYYQTALEWGLTRYSTEDFENIVTDD